MRISVVHGGERIPGQKTNGNKGVKREYRKVKRQEAIRRQAENLKHGYSVVDLRRSDVSMTRIPAPLSQF